MTFLVCLLLGTACGFLVATYAPRLYPKYPRGTVVLMSYDWGKAGGDVIWCKYLYRSSFGGWHKVQVLPGDDIGWDGRILTARTQNLKEVL